MQDDLAEMIGQFVCDDQSVIELTREEEATFDKS
jgi:hypothetical protein